LIIRKKLRLFVLVAAMVAATSASARAQDADTKEIGSYRLTMPVLQKMIVATKTAAAALKNDPKYRDSDATDDDDNGDDSSASLSDMERKIDKMPHMRDGLKAAGLTAREFAIFEMCAMQAGMVAGLEKAGQHLTSLPAGIRPENVQFMKDHEKDFEAWKNAGGGS
jgi:hypothetical protein